MTDNNGWPERPGVPTEPEKDGWHWVGGIPRLWDMRGVWVQIGGKLMAPKVAPMVWGTYGGPCLPPSKIAAREAAAWCAGRDAVIALAESPDNHAPGWEGEATAAYIVEEARALTPPADFAAALEAVRAEALRDAAAVFQSPWQAWLGASAALAILALIEKGPRA